MFDTEEVRLALIDDDPEECVIIEGLLADSHRPRYAIDWFAAPEPAVSALAEGRYDLCLLDYYLGEQTGLEVMERLSRDRIDVPVILLTGAGSREIDLEAMRRGAYDYLVKDDLSSALLERAVRYACQRAHLQREVARLSLHDPLTGLGNRRLFQDSLRGTIARTRRSQRAFHVVYIDLDRFKPVNDVHGHAAGDQVLVTVAQRLRAELRECDLVARLGGDEFGLILEDTAEPDAVAALIERLRAALMEPIAVGDDLVTVGASFGAACCPGTGCLPDDLLNRADRAMFVDKSAHRMRAGDGGLLS